jgi:hypothetical protein
MIIKKVKTSIKINSVFAVKFIYSVHVRTLSQLIKRLNEKKISRWEMKQDRKFRQNSSWFIQSKESLISIYWINWPHHQKEKRKMMMKRMTIIIISIMQILHLLTRH